MELGKVLMTDLYIQVPPQILPFDFGEPIDSHELASITCAVSKGDVPLDIEWFFNGRKLQTNDGILLTRNGHRVSALTIESVRGRHRGNYTCTAVNSAGTSTYTSELRVNGYLDDQFCFVCVVGSRVVLAQFRLTIFSPLIMSL